MTSDRTPDTSRSTISAISLATGRFRNLTPDQRLRLRRIVTILWLLALAVLAIWLLRNQRQEIANIWTNLKNADRRWLAMASVAEVLGVTSVSWTFWLTLRRLGHKVRVPYLISVHLQRAGVNFAAPFGTAVTGYIFLERTGRKGVPPEDAFLTLAIRSASVWGATIVVLVITAALSGRPLMIVGSIALLIVAVAGSFFIARSGQGNWKTILRWSQRLPEKYEERVVQAVDRFKGHGLTPTDLLGSIGTTLITRAATITLIYSCVNALGVKPSISTVLFAYVVSFVAGRLVPFLYGMGAIEGSLSLALERGGVPLDVAIGAALLFRFFDFFLPSMIGLFLYAWDERHSVRSSKKNGTSPPTAPSGT